MVVWFGGVAARGVCAGIGGTRVERICAVAVQVEGVAADADLMRQGDRIEEDEGTSCR